MSCSPVEVVLLRVSHGLEVGLGGLNVHLVVGHACGSWGWVSGDLGMQESEGNRTSFAGVAERVCLYETGLDWTDGDGDPVLG